MKKLILPALVIVLAITSAFTTEAGKRAEDAIVPGHVRLSSNPKDCSVEMDDCDTNFTDEVCRVGNISAGAQLWRKNGAGDCILTLYKPE